MPEVLAAGLAKLQVSLPEKILKAELDFLDELLRWNRHINLTAVRDRQDALEKHLLDALALLPYLPEAAHLLDMGSGGGLPGIPLAIARCGLQAVSVDSVGKKISFQKHIQRRLKLANLLPIHARLEELAATLPVVQRFDLVVARAFSSLDLMLNLARPWVKEGGELLAMKGPDVDEELREIDLSPQKYGFALSGRERYRLPFSRAERQLLRFKRIALPEK